MSVIMPGSYDPVTVGHLDVIRRVASTEDEVYVVIFINENKKYTFSLEDRLNMLMLATEGLDNVLVSFSLGRVVDYMREHGISRIVKGYRNDADLDWEQVQAEYNLRHGNFETELIKCRDEFSSVSSTLVRERIRSGESLHGIVPEPVLNYLQEIINRKDVKI